MYLAKLLCSNKKYTQILEFNSVTKHCMHCVNCVTYSVLEASSRQAHNSIGRERELYSVCMHNTSDCIIGILDAYVFNSTLACLADQIAVVVCVRVCSAHGNGSDRLTKLDWQTAVITHTHIRTTRCYYYECCCFY